MAMKRKNLPDFATETFENEFFGKIRYVRPEPDFDPWFVAADVCKVLGLSNPTMSVKQLDEDEKAKFNLGLSGGATNCVSESGLYRLIMASRKPEAKKFQRWVYHEVLPSIRKYGYYVAPYQKIIEIKGTENLEAFKAKFPKGAVEVKSIFVEADENEYGEESMAYFRYKVVVHSIE